MKILGIVGSPRKKGNTSILITKFLDKAKELGADTEIMFITDYKLKLCNACLQCHIRGECVQRDDWALMKERMLEAEGLVLGSPTYILQATSHIKILIDRLATFVHCFSFKGKYGAAISIHDGIGGEEVAQYLCKVLRFWGAQTVGWVCGLAADPGVFRNGEKTFKEVSNLANQLIQAMETKRQYPEQKPELDMFFSLFKEVIDRYKDTWKYEYNYWKNHGWLE